MWLRDFRSPPKALALFQVYQRFAPLTDFRGLTWRLQVEQDVCMQAYLVSGPSQGSFLHVRRGQTLDLTPPLMRIEGQLEAPFVNELPLLAWIVQGTRWWLRNLGSVLVDKPLRVTLLNGLLEMDREAFPELESAIAYHPVVPLVDGSWISLDQLRTYPKVFQSRNWSKAWHEGMPVLQSDGSVEQIGAIIGAPIKSLSKEGPPDPVRWHFCLATSCGSATLNLLGSQLTGLSGWILGNPHAPNFYCQSIFQDNPLNFSIVSDFQVSRPENGVPTEFRQAVQKAVLGESYKILASLLSCPDRLYEICSLLALMLRSGLEPPEAVWSIHFSQRDSLGDVLRGEADLGEFSWEHPIYLLTPGGVACARPESDGGLFQLSWLQYCANHRAQLEFLPRRDGLSHLSVHLGDQLIEEATLQLWPDWPLSLKIRLNLSSRKAERAEDWSKLIADTLTKHWEAPLRLLQTYPEALEEVCSIVGITVEAGRRPPGWVWDFCDESGYCLGELIHGNAQRYHSRHPLRKLRKLVEKVGL